MDSVFDISIIIPAKDEEKRLPLFLEVVVDYCLKSSLRYEIIVVDDGSRDHTSKVALDFKKIFPALNVLRLEINKGKGNAVKQGFSVARGDVLLFLDADGSTLPDEIEKNIHYLKEGCDIVIGSRVLTANGAVVKTRLYRRLMGAFFNAMVHAFLIKGIYDTQCGFKMFRREVVDPIFNHLTLDGFGFDLEVLHLAQKQGFHIKEVPVNWKHVEGSKVHLVRDSWRMFLNIFYIKEQHRLTV